MVYYVIKTLMTKINIVMLIINLFSYIFSYYTMKKRNVGKEWCFIASYVPLLLILFELFFTF